jgi:hypothetical protein
LPAASALIDALAALRKTEDEFMRFRRTNISHFTDSA